MKAFACLLRRELWEHPSLYWVPVIMSVLMLSMVLLALTLTNTLAYSTLAEDVVELHHDALNAELAGIRREKETLHELGEQLSEAYRQREASGQRPAPVPDPEAGKGRYQAQQARIEALEAGIQARAQALSATINELAQGVIDTSTARSLEADLRTLERLASLQALDRVSRLDALERLATPAIRGDDDAAQIEIAAHRDLPLKTLVRRFAELNEKDRARAVHGTMYVSTAAFQVVMLIWMVIYALDALHAERKDRSILFWKSLPVSDTATVFSKAATVLIVVPLVTFAVIVVTQLLMLSIASTVFWAFDEQPGEMLWGPARPLLLWGKLLAGYLAEALWFSPVIGWILLVSAWARRLPIMYTVLIPTALAVMENLLFDSTYIAHALESRFSGLQVDQSDAGIGLGVSIEAAPEPQGADISAAETLLSLDLFSLLSLPGLWLGMTAAGGLLFAAAWVRRYRDAYGSG